MIAVAARADDTKMTRRRRAVLALLDRAEYPLDSVAIAHHVRGTEPVETTRQRVRSVLLGLERGAYVERADPGGAGHATTWRATPAGHLFLQITNRESEAPA